jgi:hypothetical protein
MMHESMTLKPDLGCRAILQKVQGDQLRAYGLSSSDNISSSQTTSAQLARIGPLARSFKLTRPDEIGAASKARTTDVPLQEMSIDKALEVQA